MESTRALILAAGEATRWNNYLNTPKHLIEIEGERLLDRTIRLLKERGIKDIHTVVKNVSMAYYNPGAEQYVAQIDYETNADADKFLSSRELWNKDGRTIVLYGDCYFTEEAMDTIVSHAKKEWTLFCRPDASKITGTPWGECFAISLYPEDHERMEKRLHYIAELWKTGVITRCGGWELYRAMTGREGKKVRRPHTMTTNYVKVDDWTDDFDYPQDLDNWLKHRAKALTVVQ